MVKIMNVFYHDVNIVQPPLIWLGSLNLIFSFSFSLFLPSIHFIWKSFFLRDIIFDWPILLLNFSRIAALYILLKTFLFHIPVIHSHVILCEYLSRSSWRTYVITVITYLVSLYHRNYINFYLYIHVWICILIFL